MLSKYKYLFISLLIVSLIFIFALYNKPHKTYVNEISAYSLSAENLFVEYNNNYKESNEKYLGSVLSISGVVTKYSKNLIILNNRIVCSFNEDDSALSSNNITLGDNLTIKGHCIGYDDLLEEVRVDHCIIM
tara:strand:+ start:17 stop:412 length:396 start_codon:yes stop_codon:yes gene_type:complete